MELEGLGFNLCVAPPHVVVSLISEDEGWIGDWRFGDDFVVKDRSQTKVTGREIQVVEQEEDFKRQMLREDYVEDKSKFELRKHTGVVLLI